MCHTFLASLQQIFQNPLDDFHTQWYFSCKSHCSCGLVWTFPQDVVVFILNAASPWIIPERFTAPQHTRFILPPIHPDKIHRCAAWAVFFFFGKLYLENFISRPNVIPAFQPTPLQNRGRNFVRSKRWPHYMSSVPLLIFCALTIRKYLLEMRFERSSRGQEPSRGHKFSILENFLSIRDFTSQTLASFPSDLVGACLPQTLLLFRTVGAKERRVVLT